MTLVKNLPLQILGCSGNHHSSVVKKEPLLGEGKLLSTLPRWSKVRVGLVSCQQSLLEVSINDDGICSTCSTGCSR